MAGDPPDWARHGRSQWTNTGRRRPRFAVEPGPGQESVWDYPRPPVFVPDDRVVEVHAPDGPIASTRRAIRALETSQAPAFYLPPASVVPGRLVPTAGSSRCEWKGEAQYLALAGSVEPVGWRYPAPFAEFAAYAHWVSFYPDRVTCVAGGEVARAQAGGFYGGWITDDVVGPFKGEPGTSGW